MVSSFHISIPIGVILVHILFRQMKVKEKEVTNLKQHWVNDSVLRVKEQEANYTSYYKLKNKLNI